jgi:3-oxoacyl-[acyl-carrier-protein] synthase II
MHPKETRRSDTFIHYGLAATKMALDDAGFTIDESNAERVGVNVGSGIGGLPMIEDNIREMIAKGPRRLSPFFVPGTIINMVAGLISIQFKAKGPERLDGLGLHHELALRGRGRTHHRVRRRRRDDRGRRGSLREPVGRGRLLRLQGALERNDDPATASRPFDRDRDGFVLGEGAGILILEELEHAKKRGARIYCELAGMGMSADANHITAPDMDGPRRAMVAAMRNAG